MFTALVEARCFVAVSDVLEVEHLAVIRAALCISILASTALIIHYG